MDQVEIWDWGRIVDLLFGASCVWAACVKEGCSNGPSRDLGLGGESLICWLELAVYGQLVLRRGVVMDQVEIWDWGRIIDLLVGASCVWAACVKEGGSNGPSRDLGLGENR